MRNTKATGDISEACILAALLRAGKVVLQPFGDNQRYDMVVDDGGRFHRIQCKTGRLVDGVITFYSRSCAGGIEKKSYRGQAEFFGVFCPENNSVYLVPVDEVPTDSVKLRIRPAKNNQRKGILWAKAYDLNLKGVVGAEGFEPSHFRL